MTRAADLGIRIGTLPSGQTASIVDVPGVGVGHATVWRDEPSPPVGRGVARTGVTVIDIDGNLFRSPVPGGAVLNGAEPRASSRPREWGLVETPIFLTSTMQVGRVYDAACELLMAEDPGIGLDEVIIPAGGRVRRQLPERVAPDAGQQGRCACGARGAPEPGSAGRRRRRCSRQRNRHEPPRLQGRYRLVVAADPIRSCRRRAGDDQFRRRPADGRRRARRQDAAASGRVAGRPAAGSCITVVVTDAPLDSAACARLARRAGLGLARTGSTGHHGSGEIFLAVATGRRAPRGATPAGPDRKLAASYDPFFAAVVDATEEAVLNSMLAAPTVVGRDGNYSRGLPADRVAELLSAAGRI